MTETQVLFRALAETYAQLDGARVRIRELEALVGHYEERQNATESPPETEVDQ